MSETERSSGSAKPRSAEEALRRAGEHARRAAAEALAALRALLDAGALAATGAPSDELRGLGALARRLDDVGAALRAGTAPEALVTALAEALDAEIARWEARSGEDADARAVLRAFLGLRELLWELGVRAPSGSAPSEPSHERAAPPRARAARGARRVPPRVERVPVEG
jgi:hypothetical protein